MTVFLLTGLYQWNVFLFGVKYPHNLDHIKNCAGLNSHIIEENL